MSNTPNLDIPLVETQQLQPEVTMNSGILAFERAITESAEIECVDGLNSVTAEDAREHIHLRLIDGSPGTSAAFTVELPAVKRQLVVTNSTAYDATLVCDGASTGAEELTVGAGATRALYCDATQVLGMTAEAVGVVFTALADTPASYTGQGGKLLVVNDDEDAVEFTDPGAVPLAINAQTGTSYTLALADAGSLVTLDNGTAITLTVPDEGSVNFAVGTSILIAQLGAGQVTVEEGATGVTVHTPETLKLRKQFAQATLIKIGSDEWLLEGNLEAA